MTHNFSKSQQAAFNAAKRGENIFITGSGGNGKSYLTKALTTPNTLVCAPTGIAALTVKGTTCHRTFGLPIGMPQAKDFNILSKPQAQVLRAAERIIISEIGMLRVDQLELIDAKLKLARGNNKPFGGVQMIVEGDFYQLEPIVSENEEDIFYKKYAHPFCFGYKGWNFKTYELTEPQRHLNLEQYQILNKIRVGAAGSVDELLSTVTPYVLSDDILHLCCYNKDAAKVNTYWYNMNSNPEFTFNAVVTGKISEKDVLVQEALNLKAGCKVLLCANSLSGDYVNGDTGVVEYINNQRVIVKLANGTLVDVEPFTWESYSYSTNNGVINKEVVGSFTQLPITLGWAISIHKCVAEDSLLEVRSGKVRIADINIGDEVYSGFSYKKVVGKINSGLKQSKRLETYGGLSLVCSEDHRILSCTDGGLPKYTELRNIKVTDYVATSYSVKEYLDQYNQIQIEHSPHSTDIIQPEKLIPDDCYILGALIGDGCYSLGNKDYRIDITSQDIEVLESFESFTQRFGINCHKSKPRGGNSRLRTYYTFSKGFYQWFKSLGFSRGEAAEKFIPDVLKYSSLNNRKALVAGLIDTDGNISKTGSIRYVSSSDKLLKDLQDTLRSLGIFSYILKNTLTVSGNEAHKLGQMIPLKVKYKRDALALISSSIKTNFDIVPFAKHIKEYLRSKGVSGIKTLPKGRVALLKWLKDLDILEEVQSNFPLLSSEIMFLKVESISDAGFCNMYDIEVEDDHSFDTGGIIVHNCQGLTLDAAAVHTGRGCFSHGQFYVAVSRVRDLTNLSFLRHQNITERDLIIRDEVKEFYNGKSQ